MKNRYNIRGYRPEIVYVAFGGKKTYWWTRFLKKGFFHCFLVMGDGKTWAVIDPVKSCTDFFISDDEGILRFIIEQGYNLVQTRQRITSNNRGHIFVPFTCVETVKHFLGITNPFILTPYQLFKYITRR